MGLPNGVHHLAIATRDIEGAGRVLHAGLRHGAVSALLDARGREHGACVPPARATTRRWRSWSRRRCSTIAPELGVSHPGFTAGNVAGGAMQHVAFNVDTEADLLAMRDRLRTSRPFVSVRSITACASRSTRRRPRVLMIEFSTSAAPIDADEWIDPEVVAYCGIDALGAGALPASAVVRVERRLTVPQPDPHAKPNFVFPEEWKERGEAFFSHEGRGGQRRRSACRRRRCRRGASRTAETPRSVTERRISTSSIKVEAGVGPER